MERPTPQIEYLQYALFVIRKRTGMMLLIGLATLAAVLFFGYLITPVWEGTTLLLVERTSKQNLSVFRDLNLPVTEAATGGDAALDLIPVLTGNNMAFDMVRRFGLDDLAREKRLNPPTLRDVIKNTMVDIVYGPLYLIRGWEEPNWTDKAAEDFVEDWIDIEEEEEGTGVINVTVNGESPQQATDLANGMAALLEERTRDLSRVRARVAYDFVARQVGDAEEGLRNAQTRVTRYQEAHGLYAPEETRRLLVAKLDQFETDLLTTRRLKEEVEASLQMVGDAGLPEDRSFLQANIELNPVITQIQTSLVDLNARRAALVLEKTAEHPDVRIIEAEIGVNHEKLREALEVENVTLAMRAQELARDIQQVENELAGITVNEMELARLQEAVSISRSVQETLDTRLAHLAVELQSVDNEYNIRVLDRAFVPPGQDQDWPLWWLNILVGLFLAFVFGVGSAFVVEYWNEPVLSARDVEKVLESPVLGRFPELKDRNL